MRAARHDASEDLFLFITDELGIKMSGAKLPMLQSRLQRRMRALGLESIEAYRDHLLRDPRGEAERVHFIDAVTTNKTDFFREAAHFEYLTRKALPLLDPANGRRGAEVPWSFNLWCAGCSSGEEAYTLAMTLAEFGERRGLFEFRIFATDISSRVLERAKTAIYDEERIAPVPGVLRTKHLLRSRDPASAEVRVGPALRSKVTFQRLNFMDADYRVRERFEVIFFRNVMIYFDKPTQEAVVNRLCRHLVPGGYLFIGHSETLSGLRLPLTSAGSAVYRKTA